jgi:hypothetical protein
VDVPRRRALLASGLALALVAGCVSSVSQSDSSGGPSLAAPSVSFAEPSESAQPSEAPPPGEAGLTGTWDGSWDIDPPYSQVVGDFTLELVQSGSSFSGPITLTGTDCEDGTVEGTVNGTSISFGWVASSQTIQFDGTLAGTSMSGTWSANACSDGTTPLTGTWEATKRP